MTGDLLGVIFAQCVEHWTGLPAMRKLLDLFNGVVNNCNILPETLTFIKTCHRVGEYTVLHAHTTYCVHVKICTLKNNIGR
jgi:ABC-type uncharacterized transport system permease subunit